MMYNHPHPGLILNDMFFEPENLEITAAAKSLAVARVTLSRVLNGKAGISPDLAIRLEMAGVSTARFWINLQANYDLWCAQQHAQPKIELLMPAAVH